MIEIKHLCKSYGEKQALDDIQLKLVNGRIYGIVGRQGAGKTTLLDLFAGVIAPSAGGVKINGFDLWEKPREAKRLIGYASQERSAYEDMTPEELLTFIGEARGVSSDRLRGQVRSALEATDLYAHRNRPCLCLNADERQRLALAQILPGEPEVLLIDGLSLPLTAAVQENAATEEPLKEPLEEADAETMRKDPFELVEFVRVMANERTVLLTARSLEELHGLCEQIIVLDQGRVIGFGTPDELDELLGELDLLAPSQEYGVEDEPSEMEASDEETTENDEEEADA